MRYVVFDEAIDQVKAAGVYLRDHADEEKAWIEFITALGRLRRHEVPDNAEKYYCGVQVNGQYVKQWYEEIPK